MYFGEGAALEAVGFSQEEYGVGRVRVCDVELSPECGEEEGVEFERECDRELCCEE